MRRHSIFRIILCVLLFAGLTVCPLNAATGTPPNLEVAISLNDTVYLATESLIEVTLTLTYPTTEPLIYVSEGFKASDFRKHLKFVGPDLQVIHAIPTESHPEPLPPEKKRIDGQSYAVERVESLDPGWTTTVTFNASDFYELIKPGFYTVTAIIELRSYQAVDHTDDYGIYAKMEEVVFAGQITSNTEEFVIVADQDADNYSWPVADPRLSDFDVPDCNDKDANINPGAAEIVGDGFDNDCDTATTDQIADADIRIQADRHTVGGGSHPGSTKDPLADMPVWVFDKSAGSCAKSHGISWQHYGDIWDYCRTVVNGKGVTDAQGSVSFALAAGDHVALAELDNSSEGGDNIYLRVVIGETVPGETVEKYLQLIVKADGKKVPAKYTRKKGSELLIIEPEYIEWSGTEELYPFVFESLGDWSVATSVSPPEGFVADHDTLVEEVNTDLKAVQFVVTDIGSEWVATDVVHELKHKKKKEKVKSKVGIKLTKKLAKKKDLTIFGEKIK